MRRQGNARDACHCRQSELTNASFLLWRPGVCSCISRLLIAALVPRLLVSLLLVSGLLLVRRLMLAYDPGAAVGAENGIIREFTSAKSAEHTVPPRRICYGVWACFTAIFIVCFFYYYNPFNGMTSIASE